MTVRLAACLATAFALVVSLASPSMAIDTHPTDDQIQMAMQRGKEAAAQHRSPETFYTRFGASDDLHPGGFLVTKLGGLSVLAAHMALRGIDPRVVDLTQVTGASTMLISTVIFGDAPSFAENSYMVLDQRGKTIKPVTVRADGQASRSAAWPNAPRFRAKVVALFTYADFDPKAQTTITVFPANGGALSFSVDFGQIE